MTVQTNTRLSILAEYQLMSDSEGRSWMETALAAAKASGLIDSSEVIGAYVGNYGLQLITFAVDVPLSEDGLFKPDMDYDQARSTATVLLNAIVGDTDVSVRWISTR